jgi:uncharacterized protein YndB with AHSA1/START domain
MTSNAAGGNRIVGTLRTAGGKGIVRMEDRFATDTGDLWSALTDPGRLARWLGEFEGDLRLGGEFRARFLASGWQGTGWVDVCEPSRHLLVITKHDRQADEHAIGEPVAPNAASRTVIDPAGGWT